MLWYTENTVKMAGKQYEHLIHFIIFSLAIILFFKIVEPLITILLTSIIIVYISFPLYRQFKKLIPSQFFSIISTIGIIALILLLPFSYLTFIITQQTLDFYNSLSGNIAKGELVGFTCETPNSKICLIINKVEGFSATRLANLGFDEYLQSGLKRLIKLTTDYLVKIPQAILGTGLALFIAYFLFRDGEKIMQKIVNWLPFRKKTINALVAQFKKITYAIVFAQLLVAFAQGFISIFGYYIFGLPLPIFWGVITAFFALVPTVGTAFIWAPASLFLVVGGYLSQDYIAVAKGIGLFAYGILVINTIDNILRVNIIHAKAEVHPIIVILGVIGGANLFGVIGLFLGPILLSMLMTYFNSFRERFI